MKNKILVIVLISIIFIVTITTLIVCIKMNKNIDELDIECIKYSIGGGFGTEAHRATKTIIIKEDGNVKFTNTYDNNKVEELKISKETFYDLENYINENRKVFLKENITDKNAMDASTQYLTIITKEGKEYKNDGY